MPKNQPDPALQAKIVDFVTESYLATGKPSTVKEIARALFVSETKIRKEMPTGSLSGISPEQETREAVDKSYGTFGPSRYYKVWVYYPTMQRLRELLLNTRAALKNAQDFRKGVESVRS